MKKTVMAVIAAVLLTAFVMSAYAAPAAPSGERVIGTSLHLATCNRSPDNAREWTRFARCSTANDIAIQKWGHRMDACMRLYRFHVRNDDAYSTADPAVFQTAPGLAPADVGGPATLMLVWRQTTFCS